MKTFREFITESTDSVTVIPTKIIGSSKDFTIHLSGYDMEIIASNGDWATFERSSKAYKDLMKIFQKAKTLNFEDYIEEFAKEHQKFYPGKRDFDADEVIVDKSVRAVVDSAIESIEDKIN